MKFSDFTVYRSDAKTSHSSPLDAESLHVALRVGSAKEIALFDAGAEAASAHDVHQVDLLIPFGTDGQEMGVETKRVTRIDGVLTTEAETGGEVVAFVV